MNLVWTKLAVIFACTMAGERGWTGVEEVAGFWGLGGLNFTQWGVYGPSLPESRNNHTHDSEVCPSSCAALESSVVLWHAVMPTPIAAVAWLVASLPTLCMRGRHQALGIRACLWQLVVLGLNLQIAFSLFGREHVLGYVWAVHGAVNTLTAWSPPRRVLVMHASHRAMSLLGVTALCIFAWQAAPPVGLIAWRGGWTSQCGLSAHLMAVLGVDFMGWVLTPLGRVVVGT